MKVLYPSVEGAQHGAKILPEFLNFAKASGASGAQPSNFQLHEGNDSTKPFLPATDISNMFRDHGLSFDGISCHCPFWVHTTAWTGSKTIRPFIPADVAKKSPAEIEKWCEDYILRLLDLAAELGMKILPMFWGVAFGWELATGYPWGLWKGADYDLIKEGQERFMRTTQKVRDRARQLGIFLCHEIHPGTAAMCADDFNMLVEVCDGDKCLAVIADPSHCWENESFETRFLKVAGRIYACHVKNHVVRPGMPLRMMQPDWQKRAMQFTDLPTGDLNMVRFTELLTQVGYPQRYCQAMGRTAAPLVVEAESAFRDLDATSANGIAFVRDNCCFDVAKGSFEDGMGAK